MSQEWNPALYDCKSPAFLTIPYSVIHISKYLPHILSIFILKVKLRLVNYSLRKSKPKVYRFNDLPKVSTRMLKGQDLIPGPFDQKVVVPYQSSGGEKMFSCNTLLKFS